MRTYPRSVWLAWTLGALLVAACGGKSQEPDADPDAGAQGGSGGSGGTTNEGGSGGTPPSGGGTGGGGDTGGTGGTGGDPGPAVHSDKLDLLFMIDNSASMADKQNVLAGSVTRFVERLTNPPCVDGAGSVVAEVGPDDSCPDGSSREFPPVRDLHIGIISSSLGGHGADTCSNVPTSNWNPRQEEMSHLITRGADGPVATYEDKGFLNWDPDQQDTPPGTGSASELSIRFTDIVSSVGQDGCGFESSLEAWYRFLVDPAPYEKVVPVPCFDGDTNNQCRGPEGVDQVLLQQRADFLRQDSTVAIVMLTDENDCSVRDEGQYFLALQALDGTGSFHLAHGTNACKTDPYSPDCKSCWEVSVDAYPECGTGWPDPAKDDALNLRCYRQKERFGIDFLQPVERYVAGLTEPKLEDGRVNPLFCTQPSADGMSCATEMRSRTQVVLAGIVGVPWQDIAEDPNDLSAGYKAPGSIDWGLVLGDPKANVEPSDPLMVEAIDPRSGTNPVTGVALAPPGSGVSNPINGAERHIPSRNDLQYACTFKLPAPIDCTLPENIFGCDCSQAPESPLCWNGSNYGTMQHYAKAYPGRRHLEVLRGISSQAVVASICAPNLEDPQAADFGYNAALDALADRLSENLR